MIRRPLHDRFGARILLVALGAAGAAGLMTTFDRASSAGAAASQTVAWYQMDESSSASVLVDSGSNGLDGAIGDNVATGVTVADATVHHFANREPSDPVDPERLDTVPHSPILNPGAEDFAVSVRLRTDRSFGNLIQKGQNNTIGGYFKIELPRGRPTCLFIGTDGDGNELQAGVRSPEGAVVNDGLFHVVRCERLQTRVAVWIDGVEVARTVKPTGTIANNKVLSIAGKSSCDQVEVTCDYFVGDIDWVRIDKGEVAAPNEPPHAAFSHACAADTCTFDGSGSTDDDGTLTEYHWDFGDGTSGAGQEVTHRYPHAGRFSVTLTVTDDDGATDDKHQTVKVTMPTSTTSSTTSSTTTSTTTTTTTTTTTIVAQEPPSVLGRVERAASAASPAQRLANATEADS